MIEIFKAAMDMVEKGILWKDLVALTYRIVGGFALGDACVSPHTSDSAGAEAIRARLEELSAAVSTRSQMVSSGTGAESRPPYSARQSRKFMTPQNTAISAKRMRVVMS